MGREAAEVGGGNAAVQDDAADESAPQLEPISPVNPQRPTKRREAIAAAKRTVAAAKERERAAAG